MITLGAEVWNTLVAIPFLDARPPAATFEDLYGDAYGMEGTMTIGKRRVAWLPLVHPGLLKGTLDANAPVDVTARRTVPGWRTLHARWIAK